MDELSDTSNWFRPPQAENPIELKPLNSSHLQFHEESTPVRLGRITHACGVNNLSPNTSISFNPAGMNIIAGVNGSGKSGYIRILKQFAASRGPENLLPNVFSPAEQKAEIEFMIGSSGLESCTWPRENDSDISPLQRIRVFDSKAAAAHLTRENEVAYVPPSLQLLSEYTKSLREIKAVLDREFEKKSLSKKSWPELEKDKGAELIQTFGTAEGFQSIESLQPLTKEQQKELDEASKSLQLLAVSDAAKLAIEARNRSSQLAEYANNLRAIASGLSEQQSDKCIRAYKRVIDAKRSVDRAGEFSRENAILPGTGSEKWKTMWRAAKDFSESIDNPNFPDLSDDAVCVLCQQTLGTEARKRFSDFKSFMEGVAQSEFEEVQSEWELHKKALNNLPIHSCIIDKSVNLITPHEEGTATAIPTVLSQAELIRDWLIIGGVSDKKPAVSASIHTNLAEIIAVVERIAQEQQAQAVQFESSDKDASNTIKLLQREEELKMQKTLSEKKQEFEVQHDLLLEQNALRKAAQCCDTTSTSRLNSRLSRDYVNKVCEAFKREVASLELRNVPVELVFHKSARGTSYIKVRLIDAPDARVVEVLSEGEQRMASIAGFFADLTESGDYSTLVFDDPVSSLDHVYREAVAKRLVEEAVLRQVIVFTHDNAFVHLLYEQNEKKKLKKLAQGLEETEGEINYTHIARAQNGAGVVTSAEQWRHPSVSEQIKRLNERIQNVRSLYRENRELEYTKEARDIVGAIRETWESFVERELLNSIVMRHERSVQTSRLKVITDISASDVAKVSDGMGTCSRWLTGHAGPISDATQTPSPDEIEAELKKLSDFCKEVRKRRK